MPIVPSHTPRGPWADALDAPLAWAPETPVAWAPDPPGPLRHRVPETRPARLDVAAREALAGRHGLRLPARRRRSPRPILLCPGPVLLSPYVQRAVRDTVVGHREPEFSRVLLETAAMLKPVLGIGAGIDDHRIALITGSGTAANEAVMATVGTMGPTLVVTNGEFGERLLATARRHNDDVGELRFPWMHPIDLEAVEAELARRPYQLVVVVHHETSTGMLNPIAEIAALAHRYGALIAVDAVSSIGAETIEAEDWGIDVLTGSSGKALSAMPGVGIVAITRRALERSAAIAHGSGYLDLHAHCGEMLDRGQTPNTPAVHVFVSLHAALEERTRHGLAAAQAEIAARASFARAQLGRLGVGHADHGGDGSDVLTCVWQPDGVSFDELARGLKDRGIVVYNGKGAFAGRMFQLAHIGALRRHDTRDALRAIHSILRRPRGASRIVRTERPARAGV